jgi:hypothetical protein
MFLLALAIAGLVALVLCTWMELRLKPLPYTGAAAGWALASTASIVAVMAPAAFDDLFTLDVLSYVGAVIYALNLHVTARVPRPKWLVTAIAAWLSAWGLLLAWLVVSHAY